jgi:hypothetical protein
MKTLRKPFGSTWNCDAAWDSSYGKRAKGLIDFVTFLEGHKASYIRIPSAPNAVRLVVTNNVWTGVYEYPVAGPG